MITTPTYAAVNQRRLLNKAEIPEDQYFVMSTTVFQQAFSYTPVADDGITAEINNDRKYLLDKYVVNCPQMLEPCEMAV